MNGENTGLSLEFVLHVVLSRGGRGPSCAALVLVQLGDDGLHHVLERLLVRLELLHVAVLVLLQPLDLLVNRLLHLGLVVFLLVTDLVLKGVGVALELVASLDTLLEFLVLFSELLGVLDHLVDVLGGEPVLVVGDDDLLSVSCALVLGRHLEDAVGVNLESHLDLGHASGGGGNASQVELAQQVVVLEDLGLLGGDDGVARDQLRHHASHGFNAHRQRVHVQKHKITGVLFTGQHSSLDGSTVRHGLVRVDASRRLLAIEELLQLLDFGDAGGASDQDDLVDVLLVHVSILHHLLDRLHGRAEQILQTCNTWLETVENLLLELGPGECLGEVITLKEALDLNAHLVGRRETSLCLLHLSPQLLHSAVVLANVLALLLLVQLDEVVHDALVKVLASQVEALDLNAHLVGRRETSLCLLHLSPQLLDGAVVLANVLALLLLVQLDEVVHDALVKVFASQVGVAVDSVVDGEQRDVEGATTQVKHQHVLLALLVETVSDGGRSGLIDDSHHVETSDGAGVLGGLALSVVEVRRDGHNSVGHLDGAGILGGLALSVVEVRRDGHNSASAVSFILVSTMAEISSGAKVFTPCEGKNLTSLCTVESVQSRPMSRLTSNTVFSGLLVSWFLAASPINLSPSAVNAT
ncbi:hypothetical protein B566_EDAN017804 [Ephemera danica]|nr:hypothetical protein B566_EDAN017804 [Ephemera danica]